MNTKLNFISLVSTIAILLAGMAVSGCATPPLIKAAEEGDVKKVEALLNQGANINAEGGMGATGLTSYMTPLSVSSWSGQIDAVKLLIDKGANVNAKANQFHMTALSLASYNGHVVVAKLLIDKGADIDAALDDCEMRQDFFKEGAMRCIKLLTRLRNEAQSANGKRMLNCT